MELRDPLVLPLLSRRFILADARACAAPVRRAAARAAGASRASPVPVLTGGDTSNLLFGKIPRPATRPGSRLSPNPLAAVDEQGRLSSVLWSQFMMSSVPQQDKASRSDLDRSPRVAESLLFIDCTQADGGGGGKLPSLPNPFAMFGEKVVAQAGRLPDAEPQPRRARRLARVCHGGRHRRGQGLGPR